MAWYQKGGVIGYALPHVRVNAQHIAHAVGMPDVRMQAEGVTGYHAVGRDIDFQAGRGNDIAHQKIIQYALANRKRLQLRYMLGLGFEWGGTAGWHRRPQPKSWGGTDPWHKNHVHISWYATGYPVPYQDIISGDVKRAQEILERFRLYSGAIDGKDGPWTEQAVRTYQQAADITVDGIIGDITKEHLETDMTMLDEIHDKVFKIADAVGREEKATRDTQARLGRIEAVANENQKRITVVSDLFKPDSEKPGLMYDKSMKSNDAIGRIEKKINSGGVQ